MYKRQGLAEHGVDENGEETEVKFDENGKPLAIVFKTIADQYGRFSFFKVVSGKITADMQLKNQRTGTMEKLSLIHIWGLYRRSPDGGRGPETG